MTETNRQRYYDLNAQHADLARQANEAFEAQDVDAARNFTEQAEALQPERAGLRRLLDQEAQAGPAAPVSGGCPGAGFPLFLQAALSRGGLGGRLAPGPAEQGPTGDHRLAVCLEDGAAGRDDRRRTGDLPAFLQVPLSAGGGVPPD